MDAGPDRPHGRRAHRRRRGHRTTQPTAPNDVALFASKRLASPQAGCSFPCSAPTLQQGGPVGVLYQFPTGGSRIAAVVDVTKGKILSSTAPPTMSFSHTTRVTRFADRPGGGFAATAIVHQTRLSSTSPGSVAGYFYNAQNNVIQGGFCPPADERTFVPLETVAIDAGTVSLAVLQYQPAIAAVDPGIVATHQVSPGRACVAADNDSLYGFELSTDQPGLFATTINIDGALRARSGPERLVLLLIQPSSSQTRGRVVAWDPATGEVAAAQDVTTQEAMNLWSASRDAALIVASTTLTYVPLRGDTTPRTFPTEFERQRDFVVLEPGFLYDRRDTRFYRTRPPLQATALPLRLVPNGSPLGVQLGDHHTIKLK